MSRLNLPRNPHAIVEIDGVIYDSWVQKQLFKTVEIDLVTNESSQAHFEFFDPKFHFIDSFAGVAGVPQSVVRVYLGYGEDLGEPLYKGLLAQVQRGASATTFICFDMGFKMKLITKAGYHNKKDDLAILKDLAARNGLGFEGPENPLKLEPHRAMMQDEQTDWEHAMERAHDAGLVIFVRQDTLFAKYPAKVGSPVLTLENKDDFQLRNDFDFKYRTPENQDGRPKIVKVRRRGKGGKRIEGESNTTNDKREPVSLKKDMSEPSKAKLTRRAQAQKDLDREHAFEGQLSSAFPLHGERLDVRNTVQINGIGKLFSGKYICNTVNYHYAPGEMSLNLELYRDANM